MGTPLSWLFEPISKTLVHSGTDRDFWEALDESGTPIILPATVELEFQTLPFGEVKLWVRGSGDGQEGGFELGIDGTDIVINRVDWGTVTLLDSAAHGAASEEPVTLRVRLIGDTLSLTLLLTSGAELTIEATATEYRTRKAWGFISELDAASVVYVKYAELTPRQGSVDEIEFVVADGSLYASYNQTSLELVASRLFGVGDQVGYTILNGEVQLFGGGRGWRWKVVEREVVKWVPDAGELPGQTEDGTTGARVGTTYRARVCLVDAATPSVVYTCAVGEVLTWDYTEIAAGKAFSFGTGADRSNLHIADAILALAVLNDNILFIGCQNSAYTLIGDLAEPSTCSLQPMSLFSGVSGPGAIATAEEGINVVHCPEGLFAVQPGRSPSGISGGILQGGITFPRANRDRYRVTLIRDASRGGMHIWITGADSRHFWFDEQYGWSGAGGFFPESYHANVGNPTCAWIWKGIVRFGTTTGRVCMFGGTTDLGEPIASRAAFCIIGEGEGEEFEPDNDTVLTGLYPTLGRESADATLKVYGGRSAEEAFATAGRYTLLAGVTVTPGEQDLMYTVRAPFLVVELSGTTETPIIVEAMHCETHSEQALGLAPMGNMTAPSAPCTPEAPGGGGGDDDDPPPDGPGQGTRPTGLASSPSGTAVEGSVVER